LPVRAVEERTSKIPLVFAALGDAVGSGVVSSLAHPGGNATGLSFLNTEISQKRLELLRDMLPGLQRVTLLADAANPSPSIESTETAARRLSLATNLLKIRGPDDFESAFSSASEAHAQAIDVLASPFFNSNRARLVDLALKYKLPAVYETSEYVRDGGLLAYGPNFSELFRRAASYVHRILGGSKPGDLPVEQPTKFQLAINLKTAKAIGLTVPEPFLLRADDIVE
jgi:putative ABC transport system substrate-binding protein